MGAKLKQFDRRDIYYNLFSLYVTEMFSLLNKMLKYWIVFIEFYLQKGEVFVVLPKSRYSTSLSVLLFDEMPSALRGTLIYPGSLPRHNYICKSS